MKKNSSKTFFNIAFLFSANFLISVLPILPKISRDQTTFKFGTEPKVFCTDFNLKGQIKKFEYLYIIFYNKDLPLQKGQVTARGSTTITWKSDGYTPHEIVLTMGGKYSSEAGAIW